MAQFYGSMFILFFLYISCIVPIYAQLNPTEINQFLEPQNDARAAVGIPPLVWNDTLENYAQTYAEVIQGDCYNIKDSGGPYGENFFWGSGTTWTPTNASMAWVAERQWYNYESNTCASNKICGHYTQVVWKNTTKIGCGRVICDQGKGVYMICSYDPRGNYVGQKPY